MKPKASALIMPLVESGRKKSPATERPQLGEFGSINLGTLTPDQVWTRARSRLLDGAPDGSRLEHERRPILTGQARTGREWGSPSAGPRGCIYADTNAVLCSNITLRTACIAFESGSIAQSIAAYLLLDRLEATTSLHRALYVQINYGSRNTKQGAGAQQSRSRRRE
jgi:hypothetical protein